MAFFENLMLVVISKKSRFGRFVNRYLLMELMLTEKCGDYHRVGILFLKNCDISGFRRAMEKLKMEFDNLVALLAIDVIYWNYLDILAYDD